MSKPFIKDKSFHNHLKAILDAKPRINTAKHNANTSPEIKNNKPRTATNKFDEANNIRKTYIGVSKIKPRINANAPSTIKLGKSRFTNVAKHEDEEHIRRLEAMGKRIAVFGTMEDRKKKNTDPVLNPVYFFRSPNDKKATKLISLDHFNEALEQKVKQTQNKSQFYVKATDLFKNQLTKMSKGESSEIAKQISSSIKFKERIPDTTELKDLKFKHTSKVFN